MKKDGAEKPLYVSVAHGLSWLLTQAIGARVIGLTSQLILGALLLPSDYGYYGLAQTVTALVGVVAGFGLDDILVQRHRNITSWSRPVLHVSIAIGLTGAACIALASPLAAWIYNAPPLLLMLPTMALGMAISSANVAPRALLRAGLRFGTLAKFDISALVFSSVLTCLLAYLGFGPYSFVIPIPITGIFYATSLYIFAKPRFRRVRKGQYRTILGRGGVMSVERVITALVGQGDYIVLGLLSTSSAVGTYFFAFGLASQPVRMLAGNLRAVLFPAIARLGHDSARQRNATLRAGRMLALCVMPYCALQATAAGPGLTLVYGDKWQDAVLLIQILTVGLAFDSVSWLAGALLIARGEFVRSMRYSLLFSPPFFVLILVGALLGGPMGVAIAVASYYTVFAPLFTYLAFRPLGTTARDILPIYIRPALCAVAAFVPVETLCRVYSLHPVEHLAALVGLSLPLYTFLAYFVMRQTFQELLSKLKVLTIGRFR